MNNYAFPVRGGWGYGFIPGRGYRLGFGRSFGRGLGRGFGRRYGFGFRRGLGFRRGWKYNPYRFYGSPVNLVSPLPAAVG